MWSLFLLLLVASILGSIGAAIGGRRSVGCLGSIALGFIGALLGQWLAQQLDLPQGWTLELRDTELPVIWTIAGSALFVAVLNLLSGGRRSEPERR